MEYERFYRLKFFLLKLGIEKAHNWHWCGHEWARKIKVKAKLTQSGQ
jgi:hypothetical protein